MQPFSIFRNVPGVVLAIPLALVFLLSFVSPASAQCPMCAQGSCPMMSGGGGMSHGPGPGPGMGGMGMGPGTGMGAGATGAADDMTAIHALFGAVNDIRRDVKTLPNGVETLTESDKPEVAALIQQHVPAMAARFDELSPLRMRDPLFRELFRQAEKVTLKVEKTEKGVKVVETSDDAWTVALIKAHADVVSNFIKNGHAEAVKNHELPARP